MTAGPVPQSSSNTPVSFAGVEQLRLDPVLAKALRNPADAEVVVDAEARMLEALRRVREAGAPAGEEGDKDSDEDLLVIEFPPAEGAKRGIGTAQAWARVPGRVCP